MFCIRHIIGKAVIAAFLTRALAEERLHRHGPVLITPDGTEIPVNRLEIVFDPHFGVEGIAAKVGSPARPRQAGA